MLSQRPLNDKPAGAEKYDNGALTEDQQVKLNQKILFLILISKITIISEKIYFKDYFLKYFSFLKPNFNLIRNNFDNNMFY